MSNDHYLIVSYFGFCVLTLGMGLAVYFVLRSPVERLGDALAGGVHSRMLRGILSTTLLLTAMAGFFGVSYTDTGCGRLKYADVVKERSYLHQTNRKQVHSSANWLLGAVFAWSAAGLVMLIVAQKKTTAQRLS